MQALPPSRRDASWHTALSSIRDARATSSEWIPDSYAASLKSYINIHGSVTCRDSFTGVSSSHLDACVEKRLDMGSTELAVADIASIQAPNTWAAASRDRAGEVPLQSHCQ